jgi:thioredoxin 1
LEDLALSHQPIVEISEGMHPPVIFVDIDVDKLPEASAKYGISSLPTFVFLKGGEVVAQFSGADVTKLRETVEKHRE